MQKFNDLKIGTKLITGFFLVAAIAAVIGVIGIKNIQELNDSDKDLYSIMKQVSIMGDVSTSFQRMRVDILRMVDAQSPQDMQLWKEKVLERRGDITKLVADLKNEFTSKEDFEGLEELQAQRKIFIPIADRIITLCEQGNSAEARVLVSTELETTRKNWENVIAQLTALQVKEGKERSAANVLQTQSAKNQMFLLIMIGAGLALGLGLYFARIIGSPLKKIAATADAISGGDITAQIITSKNKDEIGILSRSLKTMVTAIVEKAVWYEGMLDAVPFPLSVTDMEMNWTFINRPVEQLLNVKRKDLIGKQCSNWNAKICKTENCGITRLRAGKLETFFDQQGMNFQVNMTYLHNAKGEKIGHIEVVQDISAMKTITNHLEDSTRTILAEMDKFAEGDMTVSVVAKKDDDIGKLFNGFNKAVANIRTMLGKVAEAVSATASASNQISSSTEELAAGAQEQTQQAGEVASAVEEMTKTIMDTTKNASEAASIAKQAGMNAREGGRVVMETMDGMVRIAEVVKQSADTVQALGKSSDQIGEIVQVIDDIADQTNLLALNAAIEAARAGEQGRGFAVVADEVRKLAERTTKATKEIAGMIRQIQKDTNGAVESMNRGTVEVEKGRTLAEQSGISLKEIISGAEKVVDVATQVAAASEEQSNASEQISKNIESISSVTQESAAGTQQIARAAEDLNRLTQNLQDLLSQFTLSESLLTRSGESGLPAVRRTGKSAK
jgi:methyl-accepting chemotaxis protein